MSVIKCNAKRDLRIFSLYILSISAKKCGCQISNFYRLLIFRAKSLYMSHAVSYLYWCKLQFNVFFTQKLQFLTFMLIKFLVRMLQCTETLIINLFVTSKKSSPIHEFKVLHKSQRAF